MNKLAFITGATSGIGLATAKALAENGFDLALAARNEEKLYAVKNGFEKDYGVKVTPYPLDVRVGMPYKTLPAAAFPKRAPPMSS